jgi:hypothetical protein
MNRSYNTRDIYVVIVGLNVCSQLCQNKRRPWEDVYHLCANQYLDCLKVRRLYHCLCPLPPGISQGHELLGMSICHQQILQNLGYQRRDCRYKCWLTAF